MSIGEVCNREVVVIDRRESILDAAKLMREHHVGDVLVVEERDGARVPLGILSDRDLVVEVLAQALSPDAVDVGDLMSTDLQTARENDKLLDTTKRMRARSVRRVPVVDDTGSLVGILALDDLMELIAEQLADLVGDCWAPSCVTSEKCATANGCRIVGSPYSSTSRYPRLPRSPPAGDADSCETSIRPSVRFVPVLRHLQPIARRAARVSR